MKRIFFTVTNDLTYDQRMIRICSTLAGNGYVITLVGFKLKTSIPLVERSFRQKRLFCFFTRGKLFYVEFNIRLFFFLLFQKMECICAIDLDTILPCYAISRLKGIPRVYDAHELFCEMQEIVRRPRIYSIWKKVEKYTVPKFKNGYTVNQPIADEFRKMYGNEYSVIRNLPVLETLSIPEKNEKYILYQGAVNEGRSFETLIPAMIHVDCKLVICGDGNFMQQAKLLVKENRLEDRVIFKGKIIPEQLKELTNKAWLGLTLFENTGRSNYLSLSNRFSDYIHAAIPQICVDYPVYRDINGQFNVAVLLPDLDPSSISSAINRLLSDTSLYERLKKNCLIARETLNWQREEWRLVDFYKNISGMNE
jgi:glycosyltransferase involved in cell wall biosynthesis